MQRRTFIQMGALAAASFALPIRAAKQKKSANDKLNIGVIGVANQGAYNLGNVAHENIVALCDVDEKYLHAAAQKHLGAKQHTDWRRLLDQKDIDAVVIAIPDHSHAVATVAALKSGRHVYCEKPLTRTVSECRIVQETARKMKRVTQIGTQIHAQNNYRRVVELIQSGAIGQVAEVHVWVSATYGGKKRPTDTPPVPAGLHYDLWLGPAENIPYHPDWVPFKWRNWWPFGGGALADFGCHYMDLPHWALKLQAPTAIEAEGPPLDDFSTPPTLTVKYEYAAREGFPPVRLTWHHGGNHPAQYEELWKKWKSAVLFVGEKGMVMSDYGRHMLLPEKDFQGFQRPAPFIPDSIGHHKEWIQACKTGSVTTCNFDYSGTLTEAALLGNVAYRAQKRIEWDSKRLKATNCPEAAQFIQHHYRKGWSI